MNFTQHGDCSGCEARNVRLASHREPFCINCYKHIVAPVLPKQDDGKLRRYRSRYKKPLKAIFRFNDTLFGQDEEDDAWEGPIVPE
jgi:hypothetical protein